MDNKKLKIVYVAESYFPIIDGVSFVIKNYIDILKNEQDVTLLVPRIKGDDKVNHEGYRIIKFSSIN
jgi:hypothetical protein